MVYNLYTVLFGVPILVILNKYETLELSNDK